jgi:hypothetical protein
MKKLSGETLSYAQQIEEAVTKANIRTHANSKRFL